MDYERRIINDWVIIDLLPEVNYEASLILKKSIEELCLERKTKIAINLQQVSFLGSLALGVFSFGKKMTSENGGDFVMISPNRMVMEILNSTQLGTIIQVYSHESELP